MKNYVMIDFSNRKSRNSLLIISREVAALHGVQFSLRFQLNIRVMFVD